ncbi:hypothetical protein BACCIP111883_02694 [Sutcliffiella rhizosphaerae]|uniref:8-oxo-dGTP diphosphatase n=1 Tax=Sutcliffiella rhizosphaerae TaxID=2880967 RepID=A0ABN8AFE3_9BACI|nr:hypothetical protein BACCIP111883_02694 [Sutcliffiella rhizosphaerae]
MVFNYITDSFEESLLEHPPKRELRWVTMEEALKLPIQSWFKERFPLFFQDGTFVWEDYFEKSIREVVTKH